jgi:hypothetical protein
VERTLLSAAFAVGVVPGVTEIPVSNLSFQKLSLVIPNEVRNLLFAGDHHRTRCAMETPGKGLTSVVPPSSNNAPASAAEGLPAQKMLVWREHSLRLLLLVFDVALICHSERSQEPASGGNNADRTCTADGICHNVGLP